MPLMPPSEKTQAIVHLLKGGNEQDALRILQRAIGNVRGVHDWQELQTVVVPHVPKHLHNDPVWAEQLARIYMGVRDADSATTITENILTNFSGEPAAQCVIVRAWAHLMHEEFVQAKTLILENIAHMQGLLRGQGLHRLGSAQFHLNEPWQETAFAAREHLQGRVLGLALVEEGYMHRQVGNFAEARKCLQYALPHLRQDKFHLAWAHHHLAEVALAGNDSDTNHHALEAEQLTRHPHASAFRVRALCGLANVRRFDNDLQRAEAAYHKALQCHLEPDDKRAVLWGMARLQRLQGRPHEALQQLHDAVATTNPPAHHAIYAELAMTWLALGQPQHAKDNLPDPNHLLERHRDLALIVQAELHRQAGEAMQASACLQQANLMGRVGIEESRLWPDLFTFAKLGGQKTPVPQPAPKQPEVSVYACGVLCVLVNNHAVRLNPTGRPAELLVLLLEQGKNANRDTLVDAMWPNETNPKKRSQALWQLVNQLREALGWPESIGIRGNIYSLDSNATWHYDAHEARKHQQPQSAYLQGMYSDWVLDVARELEGLQPQRPNIN